MPVDPSKVLMVKLPRTLADELRQHAEDWAVAACTRGCKCPHNPDRPLGLAEIITVLLRRDQAHRERSRAPRGRRPALVTTGRERNFAVDPE